MERNDGWTVTLLKLADGPDSWKLGRQYAYATAGFRFLHATVSVRNDGSVTRQFDYRACNLGSRQGQHIPQLVDENGIVNKLAEPVESYAAGQERSRRLIIPYPKQDLPTRLECGAIRIALPLKR